MRSLNGAGPFYKLVQALRFSFWKSNETTALYGENEGCGNGPEVIWASMEKGKKVCFRGLRPGVRLRVKDYLGEIRGDSGCC